MLDLVAAGVGDFFQFTTALDYHRLANPNNQPVYTSSRETTSFLTESKVFGRESETAIINEWLKKSASHGNISALCIVGAGGLGKTTLAQFIFEKISKENHFDKIIWVCISTSFSVQDITRKILEDLGEKTHNSESLNGLVKSLKEMILSKKVFLILDDAWNDHNMCDWEKLIAPLKFVQQGSKILLTTRMKSVADMFAHVLNGERENLVLEGLEEQELLELLNKYAFYGYNPDYHRDLQKIGNDIVKKLRGSPLTAKVIGSLLNSNINLQYWKRILNHDSLINLEQSKDMADVLKLSYYHLPAYLQECFKFFCIFPQDYAFDKDELIKMWMASGFIHQELHGGARPEDIGEEYFNHLFRKSFLEKNSKNENYYLMHDLMHDMAQNVSKGECCRIEPNDKSDFIPSTVQHVSVHESKIEKIFNLKNLRTLVINLAEDYHNRDRVVLPNGSLKETLRLLVINGGAGRIEVPEEIGSLIHLKFLKVDTIFVAQSFRYLIPNSICNLYHLQVLNISNKSLYLDYEGVMQVLNISNKSLYSDYEGVTIGISNLVSLRYIDLPYQVMRNIHGLHKLTSLQKLYFFVRRESGCHIDVLEMLNNLRILSIKKIENVGDPVEATNANLFKKESLISLFLNWTEGGNSDNTEQVIDNLQPYPNLKELTIEYYEGHKSPIWMQDSSHLDLSSLKLDNCPFWEALPFLGQIPHLRKLYLCNMNEVKEVDYSCNSTSDWVFPSLEELYCFNMPKWESWTEPHNCYGFPNLKKLEMKNCPNLAKIPAIPFSLLRFLVRNVGLNSLPDMHHCSSISAPAPSCMKSSLRVVIIIECCKLTALNGFLQQQNLDLQVVKELTIEDCNNLVQLPTGAFGNFVSLNSLVIKNTPKLVIVDNQRIFLPVKLKYLEMGNCGKLDVPLLESASQLSTLTDLCIAYSPNITCIPSSENAFTSLSRLKIYGCDKLIELSSMHQAHTINPGNTLVSLKISSLRIDHLCLLLIEPLRCLRFVSDLSISQCSEMETLPEQWLLQNSGTLKELYIYNASSLCSLPGTMVMLTALEKLYITRATLLKDIPDLPSSLVMKTINP